MLLFKFLSPASAVKSLQGGDHVSIRFNFPKNYNDPYELFLQTECELETEDLRAFFDHLLGDIPQLPVSCFSRRPDSVPMWAHYAREHQGICLGFDEDKLTDSFPVAYTGNVKYSKEPAQISSKSVEYAYVTGKRRHGLALLHEAYRAAYFVKRYQWQYEAERRVVVNEEDLRRDGELLIGELNPESLKFIICGSKCDSQLIELCRAMAADRSIPLYFLRNGRRTYLPYFIDSSGSAYRWSRTKFAKASALCSECMEPGLCGGDGLCNWCSISSASRRDASHRNMLSHTVRFGLEDMGIIAFDGLERRGWRVNADHRDDDRD